MLEETEKGESLSLADMPWVEEVAICIVGDEEY